MQLIDYWPKPEHVKECIRTEAETVSEAVFLAVHQPIRFLKRPIGSTRQDSYQTENDLLEYFLADDLPSGTLLMPILGSSGIGKSHAVRWIDTQLRRRNDAIKRHIIRIPKSSSLKRILQLILEGLHGEAYDRIRNELLAAKEVSDPLTATLTLRANLQACLERTAEAAKARILEARIQNRTPSELDKATVAHCQRNCLPALLGDTETGKWFIGIEGGIGLLHDLAQRSFEGDRGDESKRFQFSEHDLTFNDTIDFKYAGTAATNYYSIINRQDGRQRSTAVQLLNEAIDEALAQLQGLGDSQLPDLFIRIRKELLGEGKELILLVEDFAACAGIQGALLDAVIKEGVRDGKQVLGTMRTVLAVTEGYITNRDTVMTRAQYEWIIEDVPNKDHDVTVEAITDMVGAYLNAARFGQNRLDENFKGCTGSNLQNWIPQFDGYGELEEDDRSVLNAFGYSKQGYALFPLSKEAIKQMVFRQLINPDSDLTLNPRLIINKILWPILYDRRDSYTTGTFPGAGLLGFDPAEIQARVRFQLQDVIRDEHALQRYFAFLRFWGNNPQSWLEVEDIPREFYRAFSLEPLHTGSKSRTEPRKNPDPKPKPINPGQTPSPLLSTEDNQVIKWQNELNNWANGLKLSQSNANELRKWITEALSSYIDWDAELLKNPGINSTYYQKWVYIPNASGGEQQCNQDNALVTICKDGEERDPKFSARLVQTLMTVINYSIRKSWLYEDGDEQSALFANLMEHTSRQTVDFVRQRYLKAKVDTVPTFAQALLLSSKVLNLPGSSGQNKGDIITAIIAPLPPDTSPPTENDSWSKLRAQCMSIRPKRGGSESSADAIRDALLNQVCARQGGASALAVDAIRLEEAVKPFLKTWKISIPSEMITGDPRYKFLADARSLQNLADTAVKEKTERIRNWKDKMLTFLGENPDKSALQETLKSAIKGAKAQDLPPGEYSYDLLLAYERELNSINLMENIKYAEKLSASNPGTVLSLLAKTDDTCMLKSEKILCAFDKFLDKVAAHLQAESDSMPEDFLDEIIQNVEETLINLSSLADSLNEEKHA